MRTYEELYDKALMLDKKFPGFFEKGEIVYNEYIEEYNQNQDFDDAPETFYYKLSRCWFMILERFFKDELKKTSIEDLYILSEILNINSGYGSSWDYDDYIKFFVEPKDELFVGLLKHYDKEEICSHLAFDEDDIIKRYDFGKRWEFTRRDDEENLNYAINETAMGVQVTKDIIKEFFYLNSTMKSRQNINLDYTPKLEGLYQAVIHPEVDLNKRKQWVVDFIELTELVICGKYKIGEEVFDLDTLSWIEGDAGNDIEIVKGAAYSYQTCMIYFVNYITNKDSESFHKLNRIIYLTILNVYGSSEIPNDVFMLSSEQLVNNIYDFVKSIFKECQEENIVDLKLNCLAEYTNTGYMPYAPSHKKIPSPYADELIQQYVSKPTQKEYTCMMIASLLLRVGFERDEHEYIENYYKKVEEYEKYKLIYNKLYELAIVQEILYVLDDAISINKSVVLDIPSIKRLCSRIQDFIYDDREYDTVEDELKKYTEKSFTLAESKREVSVYRDFILILNAELDVSKTFDDILQLKYDFTNRVLNRGINSETEKLLEEINNKILSMLEEKAISDSLYSNVELKVSSLVDKYITVIKEKINKYNVNMTLDYNEAFILFKKVLTTAEFLYSKYVLPYTDINLAELPDEVKNMDFSCIALEYYTALEQLANMLLFRPYRDKVLQPRYKGCSKDDFKSHMFGYVGDSEKNHMVDFKKRAIKESLELGNLAYMYKDCIDDKGKVNKTYTQIINYLDSLALNVRAVKDIGRKIFEIRELRNEAAHGGKLLDIGRAITAQDVTFIHTPSAESMGQIKIAVQCHELIMELLKLFV